ncbi:MAG: DUF5018 domain-containing protein [Tidjanibacter sp.]|nr:DUF5018 domain-containing protein [Tidjanibacter sp.]
MKTFKIISALVAIGFAATACQQPIEVKPTTTAIGLSSVSATFIDGPYANDPTAVFSTTVTSLDEDIVIVVPRFYPEESNQSVTDITRMKVTASMDYNCFLKPALTLLDLTKSNSFVYTDGRGDKHDIVIRGEIRALSKKQLVAFAIVTPSLTTLIDESKHTVKISITDDTDLTACEVDYTLSPHATCNLDAMTTVDFTKVNKISVTADDSSVCDYDIIVSNESPVKIPYGFAVDSQRKLWSVDMVGLGIERLAANNTSLAQIGNYVVVSAGNGDTPIYLNKATGSKVGTIAIGEAQAGFIKNDDAGNLLICNHAAGTFNIWRTKSVTTAPTLLLSYNNESGFPLGGKLSVQGDIDGKALIVTVAEGTSASATNFMVYWTVTDGVVSEANVVTLSGFVGVNWATGNWGLAPESIPAITPMGSDLTDGFLFSVYDEDVLYHISGDGTFTMTPMLTAQADGGNYNNNTIDVKWFNKARYAVLHCTGFFPQWGGVPIIHCYDLTNMAGISGTVDNTSAKVFTISADTFYTDGNGVAAASDSILVPSSDGYYLTLYLIDHNNRIVSAYQVDCIDNSGN